MSVPLPYLDPSLPLEDRLADLVSRLTPAEKIGLLRPASKQYPGWDFPSSGLAARPPTAWSTATARPRSFPKPRD